MNSRYSNLFRSPAFLSFKQGQAVRPRYKLLILSFLQVLFASAYSANGLQAIPGDYIACTGRDSVPGGEKKRIGVHDPVIIKQGNTYYLFATGNGISVWSSADMQNWQTEKPVFDKAPQWAVAAVPGFKGHIWAPDIGYYNGLYYLFYAVSAFGKNTSCIGLATNKTLNPADKDFAWTDQGPVLCSKPGADNWNAIDANLIISEDNIPYLFFGSFWGGIQLVRLTTGLRAPYRGAKPVTIASRKKENKEGDPLAGANAIEAPFVFKKGEYYYLFASIDYCCRGAASTYKMIVGRSRQITGPYYDKTGKSLLAGGGTLLKAGDEHWHGLGHNAVIADGGRDYLLFHAYDAADRGRSKLRIFGLLWDEDQWPVVKDEVY